MPATPILGDVGQRLNIVIRCGATFGPHRLELAGPDATPVDLTGCVLTGRLSRQAPDAALLATLQCAVVDPTGGVATISLDAAATGALEAGTSARDPRSHAVWSLDLTDSLGRVMPLAWGTATLVRETTYA